MVVAGTPGSQSHLDNGLCRVARRVGFVAICREWMETSARQKASIDQSRGYCARCPPHRHVCLKLYNNGSKSFVITMCDVTHF